MPPAGVQCERDAPHEGTHLERGAILTNELAGRWEREPHVQAAKTYAQLREGNWYVDDSRVSVHSVIADWQRGHVPEQIRESFPILSLPAIYGTIAYYLEHQAEFDAFFAESAAIAERQRVEEQQADAAFSADMRARMAEWRAAHPAPNASHDSADSMDNEGAQR